MNPTEVKLSAVNPVDDDTIDIKKIIYTVLRNWYWFVLGVVLFGGLAFAYNRYATPVYEICTTMLVEEEMVTSPLLGGGAGATGNIFQGLGVMNSMRNISNQMVILSSTPIISKTLEELDFEVSYYAQGRVAVSERYHEVPFQVIWERDHPQIIETDFSVSIQPDGKLEVSADVKNAAVYSYPDDRVVSTIPKFSFSKTINAGEKLSSHDFSFSILLNEKFNPKDANNYKFRFHSKSSLIKKYRESLTVSLPDKETSIIMLALHDFNVQKGVDFLNRLTEIYHLDNLSKKNENANRTIQFIGSQLQTISDSLSISENQRETFQSQNQVLDLSIQSQQLLEQMKELDNEKVALETQNKYYHYLKDYIEGSQEMGTVIAPSAMGIDDPLLNSLILQLNDLITQKSSQTSIRQNSQHPIIVRLNAQIESVKHSLLENTTNIISQSDIALKDLNARVRSFEAQIRRLPATERSYVNIERKYQLNNETYTFLLQKMSEAQIAKASNIPDSQVIEEARMNGEGPVEPKKAMIYAIALLLGLAFPALIIFIGDFFNNKIVSEDDIKAVTNYPVIGHVFQNDRELESRLLVLDKPNSPASEPYRAIRNKLILMTKGKEHPVIAVTSTFPKEGKTYSAINIASSFALMQKTAVILDLDLRNSKISEEFNLPSEIGLVNYIIGKATLEEITYKTKHPRLHVIPAGPIPPNPAEMLIDEKIMELMSQLKTLYDVIVIDSPPVGFVADLYQLSDIIDTHVFVVRHKYTHKLALKNSLEEVARHHLKSVGILVNSINRGKQNYGYGAGYGYGYGYGFGYGYGYGYGYGENNGKNKQRGMRKNLHSK